MALRGRSAQRGRSDDDSVTSTSSTSSKRSRSPFRAVAKKGKSLVGYLTRGRSKLSTSTTSEASTSTKKAAVLDAANSVVDAASAASKETKDGKLSGSGAPEAEEGKLPPSPSTESTMTTVHEDDESVYNVELDPSLRSTNHSTSSDSGAQEDSSLPESAPAAQQSNQTQDTQKANEGTFIKNEAPTTTTTKSENNFPIVLLLMDPSSRRFELLQLDFDGSKATVGDILGQISLSATERTLRNQKYKAICSKDGDTLDSKAKLSSILASNQVVVGLPDSMSNAGLAKLTKPILSDPSVMAMINRERSLPTVAENDDDAPIKEEEEETNESSVEKAATTRDISQLETKKSGLFAIFLNFGVLSAVLAALVFQLHTLIKGPLSPGGNLKPGSLLDKCGLFSFVPESISNCHPMTLRMEEGGKLALYDGDLESWSVQGPDTCESEDDSCQAGLVFSEDGLLLINGLSISWPPKTTDEQIAPWPFQTLPKSVKKVRFP